MTGNEAQTIGGFAVDRETKVKTVTTTVKLEVATFELDEKQIAEAIREFVQRRMSTAELIDMPHVNVLVHAIYHGEEVEAVVTLSREPLQ